MELAFDNYFKSEYSMLSKLTGPIMISLDITQKCNLKCVHCFNNSGSSVSDELSDKEIIDVANQIAELHPHNVCLCGGETLCRENIFDIIDTLRGNVTKISMVSNGYKMDFETAKRLVDSGVSHIQISLDGKDCYQHDTFRGVKGSFDRAVNAIKNVKKCGINRLAVSLVPNKLNYKTIDEYIDLCYELEINDVRMMPFLPSGRGRSIGRNLLLNNIEYFYLIEKVKSKKREYANIMNVEWGDPLDHMRRMPFNAEYGLQTYCMEVKSNGDITVTTYLPIVVGNCRKYTLKTYWDNGYDLIWKNKEVVKYIDKIQCIYDLEDFEPAPYSGEKIVFDIVDGIKP